jgi:hypothetical protein
VVGWHGVGSPVGWVQRQRLAYSRAEAAEQKARGPLGVEATTQPQASLGWIREPLTRWAGPWGKLIGELAI